MNALASIFQKCSTWSAEPSFPMRALALAAAAISHFALPRHAMRPPHISIVCLNRLLLEPSECHNSGDTEPDAPLVAVLAPDDPRTVHVQKLLRLADGDTVRAGVLDGGRCEAVVRWQPASSGEEVGMTLRLELDAASRMLAPAERPRVDLILAMPRPPQFTRLLPVLASLGVDTIFLTGAARVEKSYWSSHLLRPDRAADLRAELVDGLEQSGCTAVPRVVAERSLQRTLELAAEAAEAAGGPPPLRLLAHPRRADAPFVPQILDALAAAGDAAQDAPGGRRRVLIAVGPEGGWEEPRELDELREAGFTQVCIYIYMYMYMCTSTSIWLYFM